MQPAHPAPTALPVNVATDATRLALPDNLPEADWAQIAGQVLAVAEASPWWVGDLIGYAERHYANDGQDTAAMARIRTTIAEATVLDPAELSAAARVARAIPPEKRRRRLSWTHHRTVAAHAIEQPSLVDELLDQAEAEGWSADELERTRRSWTQPAVEAADAVPCEVKATVTVTMPLDAAAGDATVELLRRLVEETGRRFGTHLVGAKVATQVKTR